VASPPLAETIPAAYGSTAPTTGDDKTDRATGGDAVVAVTAAKPTLSTKSAKTRAAILDASLRLFREQGYEATTMRAVAAEAGVSLGNAYYYFAGKEHLVQGFYDQLAIDVAMAVLPGLTAHDTLEDRLIHVVEGWIDVATPYRALSGKFFKYAAEPGSPLSPFSTESRPARQAQTALFRLVIDGSSTKVPKALAAELPDLLWTAFLGIVLFWVHDTSLDATRTRLLTRRIVPLVVRAIGLARLPLVRATVDDLVSLLVALREGTFGTEATIAW
jgi:AcrR family transcriptional regulator